MIVMMGNEHACDSYLEEASSERAGDIILLYWSCNLWSMVQV